MTANRLLCSGPDLVLEEKGGSGTGRPAQRSIKGSLKIFSPRVRFEGQPQVSAFEPVCRDHPP